MIGRTIGRYRILEKLGEGAMGSVWRAEDPLLGRQLALKFLPEALAESEQARQRFLREARTASILNHPRIAPVFDAGEAEGLVYIAMLLVSGESLRDHMSKNQLSIEKALAIALDSASALRHAHENNVIHRDISARNLMLDSNGRAVLVDFGLALPAEHTRLTQTGVAVGTASYMSPEVVRGETADARSDLYGLGAVLYEMLTTRPPFVAERVEALLYSTVHEIPSKPSHWRESIPEPVDRIVMGLLEKEPSRRYQTAKDLEVDLDAYLHNKTPLHVIGANPSDASVTLPLPILAAVQALPRPSSAPSLPIGDPAVTKALSNRFKPIVWLLALALVLSMTLIDQPGQGGLGSIPSNSPGSRIALLPLQNLSSVPEQSAHLVDGFGYDLTARLDLLQGLTMTPWITSRRYDHTSMSPVEAADELQVQTIISGTFESSGNRVRINLWALNPRTGVQGWAETFEGRLTEILDLHNRVASTLGDHLKGNTNREEKVALLHGPTSSNEAYLSFARGRKDLAVGGRAALSRAIVHLQRAIDTDSMFAQAQAAMGVVLVDLFYSGWGGSITLTNAESAFERALELDSRLPLAVGGMARVYFHLGRGDACLLLANQALQPESDDAEEWLAVALALYFGGLSDAAVPVFNKVLELDPRNVSARWFLVQSYFDLGQWENSTEEGFRFFADFGPNPDLLNSIGRAFCCMEDQEEGQLYIKQSLRFFNDEDSNVQVLLDAVETFNETGGFEEALQYVQRGLAVVEKRLAADETNHRMRALQLVFESLNGDPDRAVETRARYLQDFGDSPGALVELAVAEVRMDNPQAAAETLRRAISLGAAPDLGALNIAGCRRPSSELQGLAKEQESRHLERLEMITGAIP